MQHSSNTKTWANDESMVRPVEESSSAPGPPVETGNATENPSSFQRKKSKVDDKATDGLDGVVGPTAEKENIQTEPMVVDSTGDTAENQQGIPVSEETQAGPVSDNDWLRSKTSRLLGLLDEEEQEEFDSKAAEKKATPPVEPQIEADPRPVEGSVLQNVEEQSEDEKPPEDVPENDPNIEHIRSSARLFVRNLPYDTTESDLESTFVPFGKVEEVSLFVYPSQFLFPLHPLSECKSLGMLFNDESS